MKKILIILILILTTGCSYKELNDLAIVSGIGIDYKDNNYYLTAQIMDLEKGKNDETSKQAILYKGKGITISEALRNMIKTYQKTLYLGHLELLVIGKETALQKTNDIFDYFISSPESPNDFLVLVNDKGNAEDIINPKTSYNEKEQNPIKDIISTITNIEERKGTTYKLNFEELLSIYLEKGIDPVIPIINYTNGNEYSNIVINNLIPFKNNMLNTPLSEKQTIIYNTLKNHYTDIPYTINYKNKPLSLLLINPHSKYNLHIKNNKIYVNINIFLEGHATEVNTKITLSDKNTANQIEKQFENEIKKDVNNLLNFCKINNVDILGLKNMIYKYHHKKYNKYKDINIYEIANFNINVNINMYRYGNAYVGVSKEN